MMIRSLSRLRRSEDGATAIEFALIMPMFLMLLFGVLQMGFYLQNHNALRSLSTDVARSIAVAYQNDNMLSTNQMEALARSQAIGGKHFLETDRLETKISTITPSRVDGATELEIELQYTPRHVLPVPMPSFDMTYKRPVFVFGAPTPNPTPTATPTVAP